MSCHLTICTCKYIVTLSIKTSLVLNHFQLINWLLTTSHKLCGFQLEVYVERYSYLLYQHVRFNQDIIMDFERTKLNCFPFLSLSEWLMKSFHSFIKVIFCEGRRSFFHFAKYSFLGFHKREKINWTRNVYNQSNTLDFNVKKKYDNGERKYST